MRAVIDTNVVVAALLTPGSSPALVVRAALAGQLHSLHDARVLAERRAVVAKPKLARLIDAAGAAAMLDALEAKGEDVVVTAPYTGPAPDPDDLCFVEVALAGRADAIVTGNTRDFPSECGVAVMTPAEVAAKLAPSAG